MTDAPKAPCCSSSQAGWNRRDFLRASLSGMAGMAFPAGAWTAGPFQPGDHRVPEDKKLHPEWLKALFERGKEEWYRGKALSTVGMPIGGICTGQLYLLGDGRLGCWDLFNSNHNTGYGQVNFREGRSAQTNVQNVNQFVPHLQVEHGFWLQWKEGDTWKRRSLDQAGFPEVAFRGEYPFGRVKYEHGEVPIRVELTAFSPFIPLNAEDSALPVTVLSFELENHSDKAVDLGILGYLQNAVAHKSASDFVGVLRNRVSRSTGSLKVLLEAEPQAPSPESGRPPQVFADFEGGNYGQWKREGQAFGERPATGTLPKQQQVSGFEGKGLVNTYLGGDDTLTGRLISPTFKIERPYLSFLIGGGQHPNKTCMNLEVDGEVVLSAHGRNQERLRTRNWNLTPWLGKRARLVIVDEVTGGWGHINVDQIEFRDQPRPMNHGMLVEQADFGTMSFGLLNPPEDVRAWAGFPEPDRWNGAEFPAASELKEGALADKLFAALHAPLRLQPGERRQLQFLLCWHFPNLHQLGRRVSHQYARRFRNAGEVSAYVAQHFDRLQAQTQTWHRHFYQSSLPLWLLDRIGSTTSILASSTCQWWRNGRFWAFEGVGCCHGTCGHVWNYAQTLARLFPELERSVRELQDFQAGEGFNQESGEISFRGANFYWAGDSQAGYVLKAYREHQMSGDEDFLERNWSEIKKALQFLIGQDSAGSGGKANGLLEGKQHNTYDIDYYGANTMVGSLYLGALRAAEMMAGEIGDQEFAEECGRLFESGRRLTMERLFNGEYFTQEVDLQKHPKHQYGDGCLADQLFGQFWAHQLGLGYLYPQESVKKALASIWKYCWAPDVGPQNEAHPPERWFARPGEAGLFLCTWPKSRHLGRESTRYRDEVWTGIEYQVAAHMIHEGMVLEALAICRGIHERYAASKRNPWNEIECGDHYARALASWGVFIGLCGFRYHGPQKMLGFAPRLQPENFRAPFTAAEGWGSFLQFQREGQQECRIHLAWGQLQLRILEIELPPDCQAQALRISGPEGRLDFHWRQNQAAVTVKLDQDLVLEEDQSLILIANWS
ncbi:MAG: hypothetical protein DWQ01_05335 [Planctomycetota bacterium]|nr:MAG: hypothetical protein DWQ01_05335 [Planctomycetota bacterium]